MIKPPLFIVAVDNGDVDVYETIEQLTLCVEINDIFYDEIVVYDSEGKQLDFEIETLRKYYFLKHDIVHLKENPDNKPDKNKLRNLLIDYYAVVYIPVDGLREASLEQIITEVKQYAIR